MENGTGKFWQFRYIPARVYINVVFLREREEMFMRKRILVILSSVFLCLFAVACSANPSENASDSAGSESSAVDADAREEKNDFNTATNTTEVFRGYNISFPSSWTEGNNTLDMETYYAESGEAVAMFQMQCISSPFDSFDELNADKDSLGESYGDAFDSFDVSDASEYPISGTKGILYDYTGSTSGLDVHGKMLVYVSEIGGNLISLQMVQSNNTEYSYFNDFEKILDSVTLSQSSDNSGAEQTNSPVSGASSANSSGISLEYQNALSKAHDYLRFTAFSYSGLVDQLEYEQFSTDAATYAADNCGADWNEQAAKKAQSYLDFSSFSRQELIDQLLYEGFTSEQAEYGVSAVGY